VKKQIGFASTVVALLLGALITPSAVAAGGSDQAKTPVIVDDAGFPYGDAGYTGDDQGTLTVSVPLGTYWSWRESDPDWADHLKAGPGVPQQIGDTITLARVTKADNSSIDFTNADDYNYLLSLIKTNTDGFYSWQINPGNVPTDPAYTFTQDVDILDKTSGKCAYAVEECAVSEFEDLPLGVYLITGQGFTPFMAAVPHFEELDPQSGLEKNKWVWDQVVYPKPERQVPQCSDGMDDYDDYFGDGSYNDDCVIYYCDDVTDGKITEQDYDRKYGKDAYVNQCLFPLVGTGDLTGTLKWTLTKKVRPSCNEATETCQPWQDFFSATVPEGENVTADYRITVKAEKEPITGYLTLTNEAMVNLPLASAEFTSHEHLRLTCADTYYSPVADQKVICEKDRPLPVTGFTADGGIIWKFNSDAVIAARTADGPTKLRINVSTAPNTVIVGNTDSENAIIGLPIYLPDDAAKSVNQTANTVINYKFGGMRTTTIPVTYEQNNVINQLCDIFPEFADTYNTYPAGSRPNYFENGRSFKVTQDCIINGKTYPFVIIDGDDVIANPFIEGVAPGLDGVSVFYYTVDLTPGHHNGDGIVDNRAVLVDPEHTDDGRVHIKYLGKQTPSPSPTPTVTVTKSAPPSPTPTVTVTKSAPPAPPAPPTPPAKVVTYPIATPVRQFMSRTGVQLAGGAIGIIALGAGAYLLRRNRR